MAGNVAGRLAKLERARRGPRPVHVVVEPEGVPDPEAWFAERTRGLPISALVVWVTIRDAESEALHDPHHQHLPAF